MKSIKWRTNGAGKLGRAKKVGGIVGLYRFSVAVTRSGCTGRMYKRTINTSYPAYLNYTRNVLLHTIVTSTKDDCMKALETLYLLTQEQT